MSKQRAAFEEWHRKTYDTSVFTITKNGEYSVRELQYDWLAWQAAQADKLELPFGTELYTYPPDAQAEIDRLTASLHTTNLRLHEELMKMARIILSDEQIKSVITDAMGGMDRYTFDEVVYIARAIESAVRDECAKLCEIRQRIEGGKWANFTASKCADAIRNGN